MAVALHAEASSLHESYESVLCHVHLWSPDCKANGVPWIAVAPLLLMSRDPVHHCMLDMSGSGPPSPT